MEAVNQEPVMLLDLERELAGPGRQDALVRHDAVLAHLGSRLDAALDAGAAPGEFQRMSELKEANIVARKILRLTAGAGGQARRMQP